MDLKLTPSSSLFILFNFFYFYFYFPIEWKKVMKRFRPVRLAYEGYPRETPIASSLVAAIFAKKLRLCSQIPVEISLEMSDDIATSTSGEADNVVYFTREQFAARLCLPIPSLVKPFLHFTRAPLALIHPNVFRILIGCSVPVTPQIIP